MLASDEILPAASTKSGNVNVVGDGGRSDLERLIRLFTNEDTSRISQRQLVVLRQVCKARKKGFRYAELPLVELLLPLVEIRVTDSPRGTTNDFHGPLLKLLEICSLAPVRDRANQEFTERGLAASSSLFRVLGGLLWSRDAGIQSATAEVLRKIAAGNDPTRPSTPDDDKKTGFGECRDDLRPKPKDINQALLLGCGVVTSAVACLDQVMGDVLAGLVELDEASSLASSCFSDGETEAVDIVEDDLVQSESDLEAPGLPPPDKNYDPDDKDGGNSITTIAPEADLEAPVTEVDGRGDKGSSSNLALKHAVLLSLLQLVRELSTDANSSAAMVGEGLVTLLVQAMRAARGIRDPTLPIAVEVTWNCLEHSQNAMDNGPPAECRTSLIRKARKTNAAFALSTWDGVTALRDTVEALLIGGFRNKDKELRNEAVIVASQLSSNSRSHPLFRSTGMLLLLLRYATAVETGLADGNPLAAESEARTSSLTVTECGGSSGGGSGSGGSVSCTDGAERTGVPELGPLADPRNFATTKEVDMELKLLLWSLLADLCKRDARNVDVVNASPLMETLLMYMDLVIEEGQSGDALPPGMSRSISLASTSPLGSDQQNNSSGAMGSGAPTFSPEAKRENGTTRLGPPTSQIEGDDRSPATLFSVSATMSGDNYPAARVSGSKTRDGDGPEPSAASPGPHVPGTAPKAPGQEKRSSSGSGGAVEGSSAEIGSLAQLFVPASVFRLPVTSIQLLQAHAMASLLVLAPRCPKKFHALGGHMVTLRLLDRLGSRPDNQRLVKTATKMLATVVSLPGLKEDLGRVGGVRIMLDRFSDEWKREQQSASSGAATRTNAGGGSDGGEQASDVRTDMVVILCRLCEGCAENQEAFRKADGVPIMMSAVKAYCRARSEAKQQEVANSGITGEKGGGGGGGQVGAPRGSSAGLESSGGGLDARGAKDDSLDPSLVHIIDCLWCAVVGNRRSEARLLQCEGLDTLLDLLEVCPVFMRHQVSGIIADLLRNKRSIPYAKAWRSDLNMLTITQLMVRLWVAEESRLGVSRPNGVLQNLWEPLQSHDREQGRRKMETPLGTSAQSRPSSSGQAGAGHNASGTSSGDTITTEVRSSRIADNSSKVDVCSLDETPGKVPASVRDAGDASPASTASNTGGVTGLAGGDGVASAVPDTAAHATGIQSHAVTLALEAGKRAVVMGRVGEAVGGGGRKKRASQAGTEASVAKALTNLDMRGKIAAVLGMVGFNSGSTTDGLGPSDLKASYMATSYMDFRAGEAWQRVAAELEAQQTNPIAADALVLDTMLERAFECAQEVKSKQLALTVQQGERDGEIEEAFFAGIIFQRDQEIRQAIIKRNALMPSATKKRLAAKKAKKDAMLKRSSDRSHGGSADVGIESDHGTPEDNFGINKDKDPGEVRDPIEDARSTALLAAAG